VPEKRALLLEAVRKLGTLDPVRDVFGGKIQPMPIPRDLRHALPHRRPENRWKRRCHYRADLYVKFKTCLVSYAVGAIRPTDVEEHGILSGVEKWAGSLTSGGVQNAEPHSQTGTAAPSAQHVGDLRRS
jgi:hypothetical protein